MSHPFWKLSVAWIALSWCASVFADTLVWEVHKQLHPHMVPFAFQLWTHQESTDAAERAYLQIKTQDGTIVQQIDSMPSALPVNSLVFADINFDGLLDLHITKYTLSDAGSNSGRDQYWFYDKKTAIFVENKALAALNQPEFLAKEKYVKSSWQDSNIQAVDYYQFEDDSLVLMKQEQTECQDGQCQRVTLMNRQGMLVEVDRQALAPSQQMGNFVNHLIDKKGVCLSSVREFALKGDKSAGLKEASQCLNTIAYELIPAIAAYNPTLPDSITLNLKECVEKHFALIRAITYCPTEDDCEQFKNEAALIASLHYADALIEQMVMNLTASELHFAKDQWIAKWEGLNEMMQS